MSEKKSFLDTLSESEKPESFAEEKFEKVNNGKKKIIGGIIIAGIVLAGAFAIYFFSGRVTMTNLVGKTLVEATDWASKNGITLYAKNAYSLDKAADIILSQDTVSGQYIKKNTTITIEVSLGADPEEVLSFPDIKTMTSSEVETWISDNQLTGARVTTAYSDVIEKDKVVSYTFTDGSEDNFKRKNRVAIVVSLGSETVSDTVVVTDFSAMKAGAVLQWGADNGISITLEEAFDDYVSSGNVISQSVKADTEILRTVSIKVVISQGKPVTVPNFTAMTKEDANTWAKTNNITLTIVEKYSDSKDKGKLYNQSIATGKSIKEGDAISLDCSLGKVQMTNYIGKTKIDILNWQSDANIKYANMKLAFSEAYGDKGSVGKILSQSVANDYVSTGATIHVVLSKGMKVVIPDFSGKTAAECSATANSAGVSILFDYQDSDTVNRGYVVSQSIAKDTITSDASPVTIVISLKD